MDLNRLFVVVVFRGEGGGGKGGDVKPFRGLGACSTEIQTSKIEKYASKLLWYTTFLFRKSY